MAVIDQKGRLFGKINLLDLVILLVVLAVAGRFGYGKLVKKEAVTAGTKTVEVQFLFAAVRQPSIDQLKVTTPPTKVYESKSGAYLGEIVAVSTKPATITGEGAEYTSAFKYDHTVTIRGAGIVSENGLSLGGLEMKVGRGQDLRTATWAGTGLTWALNAAPEERK